MRATILLQELLRLQQTQVQGFEFTETGLVVGIAPQTRSPYCAGCCRRCRRGYGGRERTWRHVDLGGILVELRYEIRRVDCLECGVTTELVPWADHGSWFSRTVSRVILKVPDLWADTQDLGPRWRVHYHRAVERLWDGSPPTRWRSSPPAPTTKPLAWP